VAGTDNLHTPTNLQASLTRLEARLQSAHDHWSQTQTDLKQQGTAIDLWKNRSEQIETRLATLTDLLDAGKLKALLHEVVANGTAIEGSGSSSLLVAAWPLIAGALGLSAPPTAVFVAWKLARLMIARSRRNSAAKNPAPHVAASSRVLNDDYARQLAEVFQHSGRSPIQDATLGREYDEELRRAAESSDGALARFAKAVRERVETRFHRIHGLRTSPAEPIESKQSS
jgi:hypothetical protein